MALAATLFSGAKPFQHSGKRSPKEQFCEIIFKLGHWPRRNCYVKVFLLLALKAILLSRVERFQQLFGRGSSKEQSCEIIFKSGHQSIRRCHLQFSILSSGSNFVQRSEPFQHSGRGSPKYHFCKIIFKSDHWSRGSCYLNVFLFIALAAILFSSGLILAILVEGHPRNNP